MQTHLAETLRNTEEGREAEAILRSCVHCGFCNATCPTYQLLGDELDGPRGRIYQIKAVLEGAMPSERVRSHLDRCLTCRACETTCPSGVRYGRLLDIGRPLVEQHTPPRGWRERLVRRALRALLPHPRRFALLLGAGQTLRPLLPPALRRRIPARRHAPLPEPGRHARRMILLDGCVQPSLSPAINAGAVRVLDRLGIALEPAEGAGCCGAVSHHLSATEEARSRMRRNIDAWWPAVEAGAEALVVTASGCAAMVKDYGHLLQDDPAYRDKAARIAALTRDLSEVVGAEDHSVLRPRAEVPRRIAFQSPCTLQHAQSLGGRVEALLTELGFELTAVPDGHLCCGSAGTYSILQPALAERLRAGKLEALSSGRPSLIATANIGCLHHLAAGTEIPVHHWIELVE